MPATPDRPLSRPITAILADIQRGALLADLSDALQNLTTAVTEHAKPGTLTITIKVEPNPDMDHLTISATHKLAPPTPTRAATMFDQGDGNLARRNPRQPDIPGLSLVKDGTA